MVIAGPDGSGKSSLVTAMKRSISDRPVEYAWTRVGSLPRRAAGSGDEARPHDVHLYPTAASWLKVLYVFFDNWVGWFRHVRPMKRAGTLLLIDRGWWDMAVDQRRYKLRRSAWLVRVLGRIVPRPDVVVILHASPETILQRKAELDVGEIRRQLQAWRSVLPPGIPREVLDVDGPLDRSAAELYEVVMEVLRYRR